METANLELTETNRNQDRTSRYLELRDLHFNLMEGFRITLQEAEHVRSFLIIDYLQRWYEEISLPSVSINKLRNTDYRKFATEKLLRNPATSTKDFARWTTRSAKDAAKRTTDSSWRLYYGLARSLVLGPLVKRQLRIHIRDVLRWLRSVYISERTAINYSSESGDRDRDLLNRLIVDITEMLDKHSDIAKVSTGRSEVESTVGRLSRIGVPVGMFYLLWELISTVVQIDMDIWLKGIASIVALAAIAVILGLAVGAQHLASIPTQRLLLTIRPTSNVVKNVGELEQKVFEALSEWKPPKNLRCLSEQK